MIDEISTAGTGRGNFASRPVGSFRGIGAKRAQAFSRLGVESALDLLMLFPRAYQHRGNVKSLSEAVPGEVCALILTVATEPKTVTVGGRLTLTKFSAFDESGRCSITFFGQPYVKDVFGVGLTFRFYGKLEKKARSFEMNSPAYERVPTDENGNELPRALPEFTPVYPCSAGLSQKLVFDAEREALTALSLYGIEDTLPQKVRERYSLPAAAEAFMMIHRPKSVAEIEAARRYFAFEEVYVFALGASLLGNRRRTTPAIPMRAPDMTPFLRELGFEMTGAQKRSVDDIAGDMCRAGGPPMSRLVSGDVGCGKTAIAAAAIFICVANGMQAALMAPTEILAMQHYTELGELFSRLGYRVELLCGSLSAAKKRKVREGLLSHDVDIVIGTHALITPEVKFAKIGLVVTDEQHRFGVGQRAALGGEGTTPHMLVMSATPIPRTLALILYGDLDISAIDEMPPGRTPVKTYLVDESYRDRLNGFIAKTVRDGGQVYIVCPAIEAPEEDGESDFSGNPDEEKPRLKSAVDYARHLQSEVFPNLSIAFMHGKLSGKEKDRIMEDFAAGKTQILVSTTVIEVGVNVPNASLMIVENAEFFGLSQLHQLRGRVGRGSRESYCVLVSDSKSQKSRQRLKVIRDNKNGYEIAKYDLQMRGPGDFFPHGDKARQHGSIELGISAKFGSMDLISAASEAAKHTVSVDPTLDLPENLPSKKKLARMFDANDRAMQ